MVPRPEDRAEHAAPRLRRAVGRLRGVPDHRRLRLVDARNQTARPYGRLRLSTGNECLQLLAAQWYGGGASPRSARLPEEPLHLLEAEARPTDVVDRVRGVLYHQRRRLPAAQFGREY